MKLLTHNFLASNVKGVTNGYPLILDVQQLEVEANEFDAAFVIGMLPKLDYAVLVGVAQIVGYEELPVAMPEDATQNEAFLRLVYHALMNLSVVEGTLTCPESGRVFPISGGIANMILNEDEV